MNLAQTLPLTWRPERLKQSIVSAALAAVLGVTLFASLGSVRQAHAAELIEEWHNGDYSYVQLWQQDDGSYFFWGVEADGEEWSYVPESNPNPEDPSSNDTPLTPEAVMEMLKKYSGGFTAEEEDFWGTMLGKLFTDKGDGIIPVHYPSPIGYEFDGELGGLGFDPNGGDIHDQLGDPKGDPRDPNEGNEDRDDYGTEEHKTGMFEDDMPGPPELINPNPTLREGDVNVDEKAITP